MNRLLVLSLLAGFSAQIALGAPADAAGATCNGLAATMVGTPGSTVTGTDGSDVIVTNGAVRVDAGGGDDVICTTASVDNEFDSAVVVMAGDGNDLVDRRGDADPLATGFADLGTGNNIFYGSAARDSVSSNAGPADVLSTGDGNDAVFLDYAGTVTTEADAVDLGAGDDVLSLNTGFSTGLTLSGGPGTDSLSLEGSPGPKWTLDAAAGEVRVGATVYMRFSEFDEYASYGDDPFAFVGSDRAESLVGFASTLQSAAMGGGDDDLTIWTFTGKNKLALDGGAGRDSVELAGSRSTSIDLDLRRGRIDSSPGPIGTVRRFESALVSGARVEVKGTGGANEIVVKACGEAVVHGRGGDDVLSLTQRNSPSCLERRVRSAYGDGGNDLLTGDPGRNLLVGGRGHDEADGGGGVDTCRQVEVRTRCPRG